MCSTIDFFNIESKVLSLKYSKQISPWLSIFSISFHSSLIGILIMSPGSCLANSPNSSGSVVHISRCSDRCRVPSLGWKDHQEKGNKALDAVESK